MCRVFFNQPVQILPTFETFLQLAQIQEADFEITDLRTLGLCALPDGVHSAYIDFNQVLSREELGQLQVSDFVDRNALTPDAADAELLNFVASNRVVGFVQFHKREFETALNADIAHTQVLNPTPFLADPEQVPELEEMHITAYTDADLARQHAATIIETSRVDAEVQRALQVPHAQAQHDPELCQAFVAAELRELESIRGAFAEIPPEDTSAWQRARRALFGPGPRCPCGCGRRRRRLLTT